MVLLTLYLGRPSRNPGHLSFPGLSRASFLEAWSDSTRCSGWVGTQHIEQKTFLPTCFLLVLSGGKITCNPTPVAGARCFWREAESNPVILRIEVIYKALSPKLALNPIIEIKNNHDAEPGSAKFSSLGATYTIG